MNFRVVLFLFLMMICSSCNYFSADKKVNFQPLDTIVDFSTVDAAPAFKNCEKLIEFKRTDCFRKTMQNVMAKSLENISLKLNEEITETVIVTLHINKMGKVSLKEIHYPFVLNKNSHFTNEIEQAVQNLPILKPAIKRDIPVATEYKLPIQIFVK
ncbi:hypothetical protein [Tenacibaculum sp. IB213877]|uniref:hypothetical protein n=1 Tax=Tenacibaculum sp. IB213877 TaxID=3097351 RepID=UPI002A59D29C|nr:hypothetical protein [Tenacibaculum sp. IB213877]MDY0780688.1 hypothetical protein [Tenacibaculum sp. IB213877]